MSFAAMLLGLAALSGDLSSPAADPTIAPLQQQDSLASIHAKLSAAVEQERFEEALLLTKALLAHPDSARLSMTSAGPCSG